MQTTVKQFTFDEFLEAAELPNTLGAESLAHQQHDHDWAGGSYCNALKLARLGWPEGLDRMSRAMASIDEVGREREAQTYDVAGSEPDVGRFLAGEPENMLAFVETPERRTVRVVADIGISCNVNSATVFTRGAALCKLCDGLEAQGHRVELTLASTFKAPNGERQFMAQVIVKTAAQPLDIDRVAFCLAHVACERRLMFAIFEQAEHKSPAPWRPGDVPAEYRGDVTLPSALGSSPQWKSAAAAEAWINAELCRFKMENAE